MSTGSALDLTKETVLFREGGHYLIGWRRHDVVVQGDTESEAWRRFNLHLAVQCLIDAAEGRLPFVNVPPPPSDVVEKWESMKV